MLSTGKIFFYFFIETHINLLVSRAATSVGVGYACAAGVFCPKSGKSGGRARRHPRADTAARHPNRHPRETLRHTRGVVTSRPAVAMPSTRSSVDAAADASGTTTSAYTDGGNLLHSELAVTVTTSRLDGGAAGTTSVIARPETSRR